MKFSSNNNIVFGQWVSTQAETVSGYVCVCIYLHNMCV